MKKNFLFSLFEREEKERGMKRMNERKEMENGEKDEERGEHWRQRVTRSEIVEKMLFNSKVNFFRKQEEKKPEKQRKGKIFERETGNVH